jgi:superfamily I DNA and/or RNA helicase
MVVCGDVKQLPAIIHSAQARDHALDVSLMERLQERAVYDLKANAQSKSVNIIRLAFNYRSHPGILLLPSTIFYNDILEPVADIALSRWNGLPNPAFPMLIRGVESEEDWIDEVSASTSGEEYI